MTDNTPETITVTIEVEGRRYSASVDFVPDGLTHETPVAEAVASALASLAATDGNLSLPCLMARVAEQNPAPSIVQAAAWVYRCSDIDVRGFDGWELRVTDTVYPGLGEYIPTGVVCSNMAREGDS